VVRAIGDGGFGRGVRSEQQIGEADDEVVGCDPQALSAEKLRAVRVAAEVAAARPYQQDVRIVRIRIGKAELLKLLGVRFEYQPEPVLPQSASSLLRVTGGERLTHGFDHTSTIPETVDDSWTGLIRCG
jgi:hypothetical protein